MAFSDDGDVKQGTVLEIQRMSTEDGPGIRTTVFFKGCSLKCSWCHNPESIQPDAQIHWLAVRCIGCHTCLEVCPRGALSFDPGKRRLYRPPFMPGMRNLRGGLSVHGAGTVGPKMDGGGSGG